MEPLCWPSSEIVLPVRSKCQMDTPGNVLVAENAIHKKREMLIVPNQNQKAKMLLERVVEFAQVDAEELGHKIKIVSWEGETVVNLKLVDEDGDDGQPLYKLEYLGFFMLFGKTSDPMFRLSQVHSASDEDMHEDQPTIWSGPAKTLFALMYV